MLPLDFNYAPMEAKKAKELPVGANWQYEPKWDGFRCLAFKDDIMIKLVSKSGQDLTRYFPEVVQCLGKLKSKSFVLDGELVIAQKDIFSFDQLLQRIHPAQSRINKLSVDIPATFIIFDLLVDQSGKLLTEKTLEERRTLLELFAKKFISAGNDIILSPICTDINLIEDWHKNFGHKLDGIIAKDKTLSYQSGTRKGMVKVKWLRTADCVVGGFRYSVDGKGVGSLLLGLYDDNQLLNHVGFTSSFNAKGKLELIAKLQPLIHKPGFTGQAPGAPSRWSTERSAEWQPLKSKLVVEVQYDHFSDGRFRHGTKFLRWRPDKKPSECTYEQTND